MLKGGVLGFGGVGQNMTSKLHEWGAAKIIGACNRGADKLVIAREQYGLKTTHDPRELCSWGLDFVLVTSTSYAHREHVVAAAERGLHQLIEKPIALNLKDADEMIAACEAKDLITVVNYTLRFQPPYLRMKEIIDSGQLGEVMSITCYTSRGYGLYGAGARHDAVVKAAESGGWLVHHACHMVDLAIWMAGDVESAYTRSATTVPNSDTPEVIWGMLALKNGGTAVIGDTVAAIRQRIITVIGTKGTIEILRTPQGDVLHMREEKRGHIDWSRYDDDILGYGTPEHEQALKDFMTCLKTGKKSPNDLRSGRASLAVCLAMEQSRKTGEIVRVKDIEAKT
jgi:predicted dehydrogenase